MELRRYHINADLEITLSQKCLNHVLYGDLTDKVFQTTGGRIAKKVISGGLHTYSGWINLLKQKPDLKKVSYFYSERDEEWFYERELQNGTILIKLPESMLTSGAAKMTMYPENSYKSGYLWKTLFPKDMGQNEILNLLDEALLNISEPESRDGEIICYYKLDEPLKCLRVSVLHRNGEINSFYPTWSQPNTGNNGKPFSFFDNIGHVNSSSTLIGNETRLNIFDIGVFSKLSSLLDLPSITPSVFLERKTSFSSFRDWEEERTSLLKEYAERCDINLVAEIYNYINNEAISKHHDEATQLAYKYHFSNIKLSEQFYNSISINQNLIECIFILFFFDQKYKTNLYSKTAVKLISNMVVSPLIDMWAKKRIHYTLASLTLIYHDKNFPAEYFDCLTASPTRREFYLEYFHESHDKKNNYSIAKNQNEISELFGIVMHPPLDKQMTYLNFLHYFSDNLGESYSLHFDDLQRTDFLLEAYPGEYYSSYVRDTLKFISQDTFQKTAHFITSYLEHFVKADAAKPDNLHKIIYEYFKIQVAQRYRINFNYAKYHGITDVVLFPAKKDDVYSVILKHERMANRFLTDEIIASTNQYLSKVEDAQLAKTLEDIKGKDRKETPRFPIPYGVIIKMVKNPQLLDAKDLEVMRLIK
jgi:hypothetical protein